MKYHGYIGYGTTVEASPGTWLDSIEEMECFGELLKNSKRATPADGSTNSNVTISNRISFLANPYAMSNFHNIRYATYMGIKWDVESVDVEYPRLILNLGGEYHG